MKILGVIPARFASSRFPGKPLVDLKGKSMIQRVYEGVKRSHMFSEIVVATDDGRIVDHINSWGGKVILTDPNHSTGTDRCAEVATKYDCDIVVNIQGDEPLVDKNQLETLLEAFNGRNVEIATLGIKDSNIVAFEDVNRIKLVHDNSMNALYFSRSPIPNQSRSSGKVEFIRHIGVYAFRKEILLEVSNQNTVPLESVESLEQLRWMVNGKNIKVVLTDIETPNIDTPEDLEQVLKLIK